MAHYFIEMKQDITESQGRWFEGVEKKKEEKMKSRDSLEKEVR